VHLNVLSSSSEVETGVSVLSYVATCFDVAYRILIAVGLACTVTDRDWVGLC